MTFAGIAMGIEPYRIDPGHDDPTHQSINASQRSTVRGPTGLDAVHRGGSTRSRRQDHAGLPGDGEAHPAGRRHLVALPATPRRRDSCGPPSRGSIADGVITVGRHPLSRRRHLLRDRVSPQRLPCLTARVGPARDLAAGPVGGRADGVPGHHHAQLPQPLLRVRPRDQPGRRRQPLLPRRIPGALRARVDPRDADLPGAAGARSAPMPTRSTSTGTRARSVSWSGRIRPSSTATTRTARARSSPCHRGRSTSTGNGPVTSNAPTMPSAKWLSGVLA